MKLQTEAHTPLWATGFWQECQILHWEKNGLFKKMYQDNWISSHKGMKLESLSISQHTKINWKWTRDLNVKAKIIQLWQENVGVNFHNLGLSNNYESKSNKRKKQVNGTQNWELLCFKGNPQESESTEWEKIFANPTSDKGLLSRIYQKTPTTQKQKTNSIQKWATALNRYPSK